MAFRFQKRIKLFPGVRLNVSKTGVSWTVGTRGASVTSKDGKLTGNVGVAGTGLSYRARLDQPESQTHVAEREPVAKESTNPRPVSDEALVPKIVWILVVLLIGIFIGLSMR